MNLYQNHTVFSEILKNLNHSKNKHILINNLCGSSFNIFVTELFKTISNSIVVIFPEKEMAMYSFTDLITIFHDENKVFYLPSNYKRKLKIQHFEQASAILRNKAIQQINCGEKHILITYIDAVSEKIVQRSELSKCFLEIQINENIDTKFLEELLQSYSFELVDFVYKPGQYALRGAIIDVFSYSSEYPYRIEFEDDEVKSLRVFNIDSQESLKFLEKIQITPNLINNFNENMTASIIDYYTDNDVVITYDTLYFDEKLINIKSNQFINENDDNKTTPLFGFKEIITQLEQKVWIEYGYSIKQEGKTYKFNTYQQPAFNKNFDILKDDIIDKTEENYKVYILVEHELQKERLADILNEMGIYNYVTFLPYTLSQGFVDSDLKIAYYTEHQIFNRFYKHKVRDRFLQSEAITFQEFNSLKPGDYVVHIDHGIGIFGGLEKIEINGKWQEQIKIVFKDQACVYMSVHNLHKISKYKGSDGIPPKLSKLGSGAWQKLKHSAKQKVKDIARDLIKIYAERLQTKGFSYSPDTYLQEELEASFFYEDTPDQAKATNAVKADMERDVPMDRLICGDVGFGKTEIAIRAAFKAVADNKQVAVLVPTTILALQHYLTFKERLEKFPCTVEFISRLKPAKQTKEIIEKLKKGEIDIIIGTHKLLSKEVEFKGLGLLIIDEEQKLGVAAKEHIRKLKTSIDTLTLSATPIPRTLQFSLMGARDFSVIQTPPPNRQAIVTEIHTYDKEIIKTAIDFEINRGGQVFFIHNKIDTLHEIKNLIHKLCPEVSVIVGHGKMKPIELEEVIISFMQGKSDVLVSTTIIENGIDIPNANTIIINNGNMFGLSDLHQLRGRVGRTNRKAYCYILTPPFDSLPTEARKRLKAIEEYNDLGSGFYIALQDLENRGAGNLLGAEQSGFIAEMGFDTYQKILQEAIQELYDENNIQLTESTKAEKTLIKTDCTFESDLQLYIPEYYVENIAERIRLYKELDQIENEEELEKFTKKLADKFGKIPEEVLGLFDVIRLRWIAQSLGFEKINLKMNKLNCYFISNKQSAFYESSTFKNILAYLQQNYKVISLKEQNNRLFLQFDKVNSLEKAILFLEDVNANIK